MEGGSPEGDDPKLLPEPPDFSKLAKGLAANAKPEGSGKAANGAPETLVDGVLKLAAPATFVGARAGTMAEGASIQVVAQLPDGEIRPLIWIYDYKPKFDRAYYFEKPQMFPAGTRIEVFPKNGGSLALIAKK